MADFMPVADVAEVAPGTSKIVVVAGHIVALFNVGGTFYALSNTCLHRGGPVGEGELDGDVLPCPLHGGPYDVRSGRNLANPFARLAQYEVKVEGGQVLLAPP